MRQSLRLGTVAGIPLGMNWSVVVIVAIIADILGAGVLPAAVPHQPTALYWAVAVLAALIFAASLLAHEMAHALVAKRHGMKVRSITLWMLGGVAELEGDPPDPGADLRIALAGPATSMAVAILMYGAARAIGAAGGSAATLAAAAVAWMGLMNGVLAVFNLLPGAPMDGGRVLRAVLWRRYGDRQRAALAATKAGRYLGFGLIALGVAEIMVTGDLLGGLWLMLIGWFLESAARAEAQATLAGVALVGLRVQDVMTPDPDLAPGWSTVQDFAGRVVAHSRQMVYPVVGFDGQLAGIVTTDLLARIRPDQRAVLRVDQVAVPVPPAYLAAPGDPAASLLTRPLLAGVLAAVVLDGGRVTGIVTADDMGWVLRRARLVGQPGERPRGDLAGV
ncbi:MAG TPA: site-2 protease family protein [Streptosporangiaceae bacterium]|nr:site-2 protease family protein [Streptosporangiaceae bacterium]